MGFNFNPHYESANSASLIIGQKNIIVMLFDEPSFKNFIGNEITDTRLSNEVLLSIDAESKEEVDEMARRSAEVGGSSNHKPKEMEGMMYGCLFKDPDGHCWNVLYMNMSKR